MKKIKLLVILPLFAFTTCVFSQHRKVNQLPSFDKHELHWGFYLGWNNSDYKINYKPNDFPNTSVELDSKTGFNVGLIADMKIDKHFNLRLEPGLISNESTLYFIDNNNLGVYDQFSQAKIESTYLHVPILIKYSAFRLNNVKPYLIGGFSYDYNFSSNQKSTDDNFSGQFRTRTHNFMYEVGFGFDFYFHYFKFSPSIRGQFAMTNEILYDNPQNGPSPWTDPIEFMGSRSLFIKLAFE
ncbi:porin family protein [Flavicella sp.]|uniref:type IX secretion/gliding motility protein PorT/SprT n=1 Tax=Flavicella sp. TaxID=2957742 RepID=UPI00260FC313|nr:porin family protein [Flavicella sp.]MDG1804456.1 porin family protein [Flavicella sp.]MDG2280038.1 porin family protein [Flavicella sp.]